MTDHQAKYLSEVEHRLRREGFTVQPEYAGLLPIEKDAHRICNVNAHGNVSYDPDHVRRNGLEDALDHVRCIADETLTYYRLLAEFDNIVLAGHEREGGYGVEFVTWERVQDGTSLWDGHYYDNDYAAAKQDFAVRSGLIPSGLLFTQDQLAVIFDAAQHMTALGLVSNPEQEKLLEQIMEQVEEVVPQVIDLANELTQSPKQQEPGEMQLY